MVKEEPVVFKSKGKNCFGIFHWSKPKAPMIIMVHGFTGTKLGSSAGLFVNVANELAKRGFNVFRYDSRGSGDSDGIFENQNLTTCIEDFKSAIDFVAKRTKSPIGAIGHSRGGEVVIIQASKDKRIECISCWSTAGIGTWKRELDAMGQENFYYWKGFKITKENVMDMMSYNPVEYVRKIKIPILFVHGAKDDDVEPIYSEDLYEAAKSTKEFSLIEDADHIFFKAENQKTLTDLNVRWFKKHLS